LVAPGQLRVRRETTAKARAERLEPVGRFIRAHHDKMLEREAWAGRYSYYFRSHHHPSNPYLASAFSALDLKDVTHYNLVIESVCHALKDGKVVKRVVARPEDSFNVR
jgi:hypothetical protein